MIRFLLDTDHVSLIERGHVAMLARLERHIPVEIAISIVTVEESLRGRMAVTSRAATSESRIRAYREFLESLVLIGRTRILGYDGPSEETYRHLLSLKLRVGTQDLKIASIAPTNSLVVVTRNRRDFGRVPGLVLEDWSVG